MAETPETLVVKQELGHCPRMQGHHTHTGASQGVGEKTWISDLQLQLLGQRECPFPHHASPAPTSWRTSPPPTPPPLPPPPGHNPNTNLAAGLKRIKLCRCSNNTISMPFWKSIHSILWASRRKKALPCLTSGMRVRVELIIKVSVRMRSIKGCGRHQKPRIIVCGTKLTVWDQTWRQQTSSYPRHFRNLQEIPDQITRKMKRKPCRRS